MIIEKITSPGLAHNSYFISFANEAIIIDPRRDCEIYVELAKQEEVKIRYIFETHRNEDYVTGSLPLSRFTGADIFHGPGLKWGYGNTLEDEKIFNFEDYRFTAMHTPGHTDESMSYVLSDREEPIMVFTGDDLFMGDVGRIDLYGPYEAPRLAGNLYDSVFQKILPLGDGVILCPAHGAGSVCGRNISEREISTIGIERNQNPALQLTDKEEFIKFKVREQHEFPPYFRQMESYNLLGPPILEKLPEPLPLTPLEFRDYMKKGAVGLDARSPPAFGGAHIRGSFNIWLEGIPSYAGWVLSYDKPVLLLLEHRHELDTAVRYLVRLGYDNIPGYLKGGIESWYGYGFELEHMDISTVYEIKKRLDKGEELQVLDVRTESEWKEGHIKNAINVPVGQLQERLNVVKRDRPIATVCNIGNRAGLAASILLREGYTNVCCDVLGSMKSWKANDYPMVRE